MWNSLPVLNAIAFWGLWTAGIAGAIAALSGLAGGIAASRASDITAQAAERSIATANSRAALANARAEQARLQVAQIVDAQAWRVLLPEQKTNLVAALKGQDLKIWTSFVGDDPEAVQYRNQIDEALKEAGIETHFFSGWQQAAGISLLGNDTPERRAFAEAFARAGIRVEIKPPHPNSNFGTDYPCLIIGTKPERL